MEIPKGVQLQGVDRSQYVLQLVKNLYGQKQAGQVWYQHLVQGLQEIGFTCSKIDECVFYYKNSVLLIYVDDSILIGPDKAKLEHLIKLMIKRFEIQREGNLGDFLGIQIAREPDGTLILMLPQPIASILQDLGLDKQNVKRRMTPVLKTVLIHKDPDGEPFGNSFHYCSIIGKLNYLEKSTSPEIAYAVNQCARYCNSPKAPHGKAIRRIGRYLATTREQGLKVVPEGDQIECYVDASHAGDWKQLTAIDVPDTARSRTGYVLSYAKRPLVWASKLQTEIGLLMTEAE